jgi:TonB family protein
MPAPPYTKEARDAKFQGTVGAEAIITVDRRVTNIRVVKSPGLGIDESAMKTLNTWKCKPVIHDGKPVPAKVLFEIAFT